MAERFQTCMLTWENTDKFMNLCQKAPAKGLVDLHNRSFGLQNTICTLLWHGGPLVRSGMEGARLFRKQMDFPEIDPSEGKAVFLQCMNASIKERISRFAFLEREFRCPKENDLSLGPSWRSISACLDFTLAVAIERLR